MNGQNCGVIENVANLLRPPGPLWSAMWSDNTLSEPALTSAVHSTTFGSVDFSTLWPALQQSRVGWAPVNHATNIGNNCVGLLREASDNLG